MLILTSFSACVKEVYDPKAFILHAALRRQTFVHCAQFPVAATRRCVVRVSVPLWGYTLSRPLPVVALVGHYPTNKLMGPRLLSERIAPLTSAKRWYYWVLPLVSQSYSQLGGRFQGITNSFATGMRSAHSSANREFVTNKRIRLFVLNFVIR